MRGLLRMGEKTVGAAAGADASLSDLAFPYDGYRAGQRKFAANVYVAIREKKRLFAQAPTGIGKTMAALYPGHAGRWARANAPAC